MNFTISGEPFTFTVTVDGDGNLTAFSAADGETTYDCRIQLMPHDEAKSVRCCTPEGCMAGTC